MTRLYRNSRKSGRIWVRLTSVRICLFCVVKYGLDMRSCIITGQNLFQQVHSANKYIIWSWENSTVVVTGLESDWYLKEVIQIGKYLAQKGPEWKIPIIQTANSIEPHCLPRSLWILNMILDESFFINIADIMVNWWTC